MVSALQSTVLMFFLPSIPASLCDNRCSARFKLTAMLLESFLRSQPGHHAGVCESESSLIDSSIADHDDAGFSPGAAEVSDGCCSESDSTHLACSLVIFTRRDIRTNEELCISYKGVPVSFLSAQA